MVATPGKDAPFHVHTDDLAKRILDQLKMPALDLSTVIKRGVCLRGTTSQLKPMFERIGTGARREPVAAPEVIAPDLTQAVIVMAQRIAGENATVGVLNSALVFVLISMKSALDGGDVGISTQDSCDNFTAFDIDRQAAVVLNELRAVAEESAFNLAYQSALRLNERLLKETGRPTIFRFLESTWHQSYTLRALKQEVNGEVQAKPVYHNLLDLLAEEFEKDGRFIRTDEEFDAMRAAAQAQHDTALALQGLMKTAVLGFLKKLMPETAAPPGVTFSDGCAPDLSDCDHVEVQIIPGPIKRSFQIVVMGIDSRDSRNLLETISEFLKTR